MMAHATRFKRREPPYGHIYLVIYKNLSFCAMATINAPSSGAPLPGGVPKPSSAIAMGRRRQLLIADPKSKPYALNLDLQEAVNRYAKHFRSIEEILDLVTPVSYNRQRMARWRDGREQMMCDRPGPRHIPDALSGHCFSPVVKKTKARPIGTHSSKGRPHPVLRLTREVLLRCLIGHIQHETLTDTTPYPPTMPDPYYAPPPPPAKSEDDPNDSDESPKGKRKLTRREKIAAGAARLAARQAAREAYEADVRAGRADWDCRSLLGAGSPPPSSETTPTSSSEEAVDLEAGGGPEPPVDTPPTPSAPAEPPGRIRPTWRAKIFDYGGCAIRWRRVLNDLLRAGCPEDELPRIHVNAPFRSRSQAQEFRGATHDPQYWDSHADMVARFPGVFTDCDCLGSGDAPVCPHHVDCTHCVMVDSVYYLRACLPALAEKYTGRLYTLHHEYHTARGSLSYDDGGLKTEMNWIVENRGVFKGSVAVDAERYTTGSRNHIYEYGPHWNPHMSGGLLTEGTSTLQVSVQAFQPFGDVHTYVLGCVSVAAKGTILVPSKQATTVTLPNDVRAQSLRNITAKTQSVIVMRSETAAGGTEEFLIPQGALMDMQRTMSSGYSPQHVGSVAQRVVDACSAIPPDESARSIAYLAYLYPMYVTYHQNMWWRPSASVRFYAILLALSLIYMVMKSGDFFQVFGLDISEFTLLAVSSFALGLVISFYLWYSKLFALPEELLQLPEFGPRFCAVGDATTLGAVEASHFHHRVTMWSSGFVQVITGWSRWVNWVNGLVKVRAYLPSKRNATWSALTPAVSVFLIASFFLVLAQGEWTAAFCFALVAVMMVSLWAAFAICGYGPLPEPHVPHFTYGLNIEELCRATLNNAERLRYTYTFMGDDSLIFGAKPIDGEAFCDKASHTGHKMTIEHCGPSVDGVVLSAIANPMVYKGRRVHINTNLPGRLLAKLFTTAKVIPSKWAPGTARGMALCNLAAFGQIPILGSIWLRVLELTAPEKRKRLPKYFMPEMLQKAGTIAALGTYRSATWDFATLDFWAQRYGLTYGELIEADAAARTIPALDVDFLHPAVLRIIQRDTEYQQLSGSLDVMGPSYEYGTTMRDELIRSALFLLSSPVTAAAGIFVGLAEVQMTGTIWPLFFHGISAAVTGVFGVTGLAASALSHVVCNYLSHHNNVYKSRWYVKRKADLPRACVRRRPEIDGATRPYECTARPYPNYDMEPTAKVSVKLGTTTLFSHKPCCDREVVSRRIGDATVHLTEDTWVEIAGVPAEARKYADCGDLSAIDAIPCGPPAITPTTVGPHVGLYPEVERPCIHGSIMALLERRLKAQTPKQNEEVFALLCYRIVEPIRRYLRGDPLLTGDPHVLFEWWLARRQFPEHVRVRLRKAHILMQTMGWTAEGREGIMATKTFLKLEVLLKRLFKSRAITCMDDRWNILIAPAVQRAAELVGDVFKPGRYAELPGAPNLDLVWLKGGTARQTGEYLHSVALNKPYSLGTDGVSWDGSHTLAQMHNVDVFSEYYPPAVRAMYRNRLHEATSRVNIATRKNPEYVRIATSVHGTLLTGQPDVSLTNSLLRVCVDVYSCGFKP